MDFRDNLGATFFRVTATTPAGYNRTHDRHHRSMVQRPDGGLGSAREGRRRYLSMHSSLIGKVEKANRYARELDRMTIDRLSLTFRGDNDTHHVSLDAGQWNCTCHYFESWGSCVHLLTLQKVFGVMLPEESQVSIFTAGQPVTA